MSHRDNAGFAKLPRSVKHAIVAVGRSSDNIWAGAELLRFYAVSCSVASGGKGSGRGLSATGAFCNVKRRHEALGCSLLAREVAARCRPHSCFEESSVRLTASAEGASRALAAATTCSDCSCVRKPGKR